MVCKADGKFKYRGKVVKWNIGSFFGCHATAYIDIDGIKCGFMSKPPITTKQIKDYLSKNWDDIKKQLEGK